MRSSPFLLVPPYSSGAIMRFTERGLRKFGVSSRGVGLLGKLVSETVPLGSSLTTRSSSLSPLLLRRFPTMKIGGPPPRCIASSLLYRRCETHSRPPSNAALEVECTGSSRGTTDSSLHLSPRSNDVSAAAKTSLEDDIIRFIPQRFTTISQIARCIPGDILEALQEQEEGGLKQFLERRPKLFEVTRVAGVPRAKLRYPWTNQPSAALRSTPTNGCDSKTPTSPDVEITVRRMKLGIKVPPHLHRTYPRYCIPFSSLLHHRARSKEENAPNATNSNSLMSSCEEKDWEAHLWSQLEEDAAFLRIVRLYEPTDDRDVQFARTFVSILPEYTAPAGKLTEADQLYAAYEVEPHEWFRIARLSPFTRTFLVVTPKVLQEASQLLPPHRDPVHVWASAPELFEITIGDGDQGELGMLCVRYILHPSYMATGENKTEEEIIRQLDELSGPTQRTKKKRRRLRRALQCLQEPLSFLDDRVWAHFIFDSLPESGSTTAERVVSMLPEAYKNCTPVQWRSTLQKFPMLFKVYDGPVDLIIQRADLPVMQMRPLQDITAEEILQEIYKAYPLRFHPVIGVTISQMLTKLPRAITQRLYTIQNVENELLLPFKDKVEILRDHTFFIEQQGGPPVYSACGRLRVPFKSRPEMLLQVRGREDFLIGFRFVGEWQDRLLEKYIKRCQKYECDPESTSFLPIPV